MKIAHLQGVELQRTHFPVVGNNTFIILSSLSFNFTVNDKAE